MELEIVAWLSKLHADLVDAVDVSTAFAVDLSSRVYNAVDHSSSKAVEVTGVYEVIALKAVDRYLDKAGLSLYKAPVEPVKNPFWPSLLAFLSNTPHPCDKVQCPNDASGRFLVILQTPFYPIIHFITDINRVLSGQGIATERDQRAAVGTYDAVMVLSQGLCIACLLFTINQTRGRFPLLYLSIVSAVLAISLAPASLTELATWLYTIQMMLLSALFMINIVVDVCSPWVVICIVASFL